FFFQAEDGIRDFHVTGVQTCALPISTIFLIGVFSTHFWLGRTPRVSEIPEVRRSTHEVKIGPPFERRAWFSKEKPKEFYRAPHEIGRASCRERETDSVGSAS